MASLAPDIYQEAKYSFKVFTTITTTNNNNKKKNFQNLTIAIWLKKLFFHHTLKILRFITLGRYDILNPDPICKNLLSGKQNLKVVLSTLRSTFGHCGVPCGTSRKR